MRNKKVNTESFLNSSLDSNSVAYLNTQSGGINFYKEITRITALNQLSQIYEEAMGLIMHLNDVDGSMIYIVDNYSNEAVLEAYKNLPEEYIQRAGKIPYPKGITWKIIRESTIQNINDVQESKELGEAGKMLGHRSNLGIPILLENKCIGVIWFFSYKPSRFEDNLIELLEILGKQLANVISRIKNREELKVKNIRLATLSNISQIVNNTTNLELLIDNIKLELKEIDTINTFAVYIIDENKGKKVACLKIHNDFKGLLKKNIYEHDHQTSISWQCIYLGKPIYLPYDKIKTVPNATMAKGFGALSFIAIPIKIDTNTIGTCNFINYNKEYFTDDELEFLKAIGSQIGTAIAKTEMLENYHKLSVRDKLSELYNRRYFDEFLKTSIEYSFRYKEYISLILIDLDNFKNINDTYGHLTGDKAIKSLSKFILNNIRITDIPARYGGDEFAIILQHTDYDQSKRVAEKLIKSIKLISVDGDIKNIQTDISIGITTSNGDIKSETELIDKADNALYEAKKRGKNCIVHYTDI